MRSGIRDRHLKQVCKCNQMISEDLVFVQLAQVEDYICIVELACLLDASVAEVRQALKNLGDRVENNGHDQWRVVRTIANQNLLSKEERLERDHLENTVQPFVTS